MPSYPNLSDQPQAVQRAIKDIFDFANQIQRQVEEIRKFSTTLAQHPPLSINEVKQSLQSPNPTSLNVEGLLGVLAQPQKAGVPTVTALPDVLTSQDGELCTYNQVVYRFDTTTEPGTWIPLTVNLDELLELRALLLMADTSLSVSTDQLLDLSVTAKKLSALIGGENLCSNSSFEVDANVDGFPDDWWLYNNGPEAATLVRSAVAPFHGTYHARVSWAVPNTSTKGVYHGGFVFKLNTWYVISWWAKASQAFSSGMHLRWSFDPDLTETILNPNLSTTYQRYAYRVKWVVNPLDSQVYITIITSGGQPGSDLDIDAVEVQIGDYPTGYIPDLLPTPQQALDELRALIAMADNGDPGKTWGSNVDAGGYNLSNLGKLRIGAGNPTYPLHVVTANAGDVIGLINNTSATGFGIAVRNANTSNYGLSVQDAAGYNNVTIYGDGKVIISGINSESWTHGFTTEEITLSTVGTTTDSAANLLPVDSIIEAVVARVTTTITVATDWKLGDGTTAGRFTAAQSGGQLNAGATVVGLVHADQTGAAGPIQSSAAKLRITTTGTPGAGKIRVTVFYRQFIAPAS